MEDETFSQMHHKKWGEGLLLYNDMHKFKHILCEDCKVGGSTILYYAGLTTPVSYCFDLISFITILKWMQYRSGTSTRCRICRTSSSKRIYIYIICKHVDRQYYSCNYSSIIQCQLIDSHNI